MSVIKTNDQEFEKLLKENSKVVVKFYADWCGSCRLFAPKFRRMSEDSAFNEVTFLDVNAEENPNARKMAGVSNLPFFAVFRDGVLVEGDSTAKEDSVRGMIEKLN